MTTTSAAPDAPPLPSAPDDAEEGEGRPWARLAILLAVLAGAAFRLIQYAGARSLWFDEALIAGNVLSRDLGGLLERLTGGQAAPAGYLYTLKTVSLVIGDGELALRLPSLLAGLAALVLVVPTARRWLSEAGTAAATAYVALLPYLVYFASEVKQYSFDVLATVVLLLLAPLPDASTDEGRPVRSPWPFALAAAVAVWFSQPAVFVAAGIALAALLHRWRSADRAGAVRVIVATAAWGASFAVSYLLSRALADDTEFLRAWWRSGFMPLPPTSLAELDWFRQTLLRVLEDPLGRYDVAGAGQLVQGMAALLLVVAGCVALARGRRWTLVALALPVLGALAASGLDLFPFGSSRPGGGRVLLFLAPLAALLLGAGFERLRALPGALGWLSLAVLAVALGPLAYANVAVFPHGRAELRPVATYVAERRGAADAVWVYYDAVPAFRYYAPRVGLAEGSWIAGRCARPDPGGYLRELEAWRGKRVWVVFTGLGAGARDFDERGLILQYLRQSGALADRVSSTGAEAYLFDLSAAPELPPAPIQVPRFDGGPADECRGPWRNPDAPAA